MDLSLLRPERYELPPNLLNHVELQEREFKLFHFREISSVADTVPMACDRQQYLRHLWDEQEHGGTGGIIRHGEHVGEDEVADMQRQCEHLETLIRLIRHSQYCPQCVTFPVDVPYYNLAKDGRAAAI